MSTPSSVSIGIELEFTVAQHADKDAKASPKDSRWICDPHPEDLLEDMQSPNPSPFADSVCIMKVCETIAARGFPVACYLPPEPIPQNPITMKVPRGCIIQMQGHRDLRVWNKRSSFFQRGPKPSRFDYWVVDREIHITMGMISRPLKSAPKGYNWYGTEISSPIFVGPSELQEGLPQLRQILTTLRDNIVLWTTSKCGLHIHVGDSGKELELDVIKRAVSLVYLLEQPLLAELCHPIRRKSLDGFYISLDSGLAKEMWPARSELEGEGAVHIEELKRLVKRLKNRNDNIEKFYQSMHRIWFSSNMFTLRRSLRKFTQNGGTPPRCGLYISDYETIEFRYPEASFDVEFINRWAMLCRHIFGIALRSPEEFGDIFYRVFELVTQAHVPSWQTMMGAIGFTVHPDKWNERIKKYDKELKDLDAQPIVSEVGVASFGQSSVMG